MPPDDTVPLVRFSKVRKRFAGGAEAVRDLSLHVDANEIVTLLGPSGCGKTAALMMLAGFASPDGGEISLAGRTLSRTPPHRRGIGVVGGDADLFPHLSVAENVAFPLRVRGVGRRERRARVGRALALLGLERAAGSRPMHLSPEDALRTAMARALVFEPPILLLDDPLARLPGAPREELAVEFRRLLRHLGLTTLHATSDRAEALAMADRIVVMARGTAVQTGTPLALYDEPDSELVARSLGESNLLAGTLEAVDEEFATVRLAGGIPLEGVVADGVQVGEACVMSVRPERIAVAAGLTGEAGLLQARLLQSVFRGDHTRLRFALGPGEDAPEIVVKRPAGAGLGGLAPGRTAALAWQPHHARVFARNERDVKPGAATARCRPGQGGASLSRSPAVHGHE